MCDKCEIRGLILLIYRITFFRKSYNGIIPTFQDIAWTRIAGSLRGKKEEKATSGIPQVKAAGTICRRPLNKRGECVIYSVATS